MTARSLPPGIGIQSLSSRMKSYESTSDISLPLTTATILRLDGHKFSAFTAHFHKPFDQRIHNAMIETTKDLLRAYPQATVAYTHSDEITLIFPNGVQAFNERVQKIVSLAASLCSVKFNLHLSLLVAGSGKGAKESELVAEDPSLVHGVLGTACFDARLFSVPSVEEALNCLLWRCKGDAVRNSVNAFARTIFTDSQLHKKSVKEIHRMMEKRGINFEDSVPKWAIEGSLVKSEQFEREGVNLKIGEREVTWRARMRVEDRGITVFSEENLRLVKEKYW